MPYINSEDHKDTAHRDGVNYGGKLKATWENPREVLYEIWPPVPPDPIAEREFIFMITVNDPDQEEEIILPLHNNGNMFYSNELEFTGNDIHLYVNYEAINIGSDPDHPNLEGTLTSGTINQQASINANFTINLPSGSSGDYYHIYFFKPELPILIGNDNDIPVQTNDSRLVTFNSSGANDSRSRIIEWYEILPEDHSRFSFYNKLGNLNLSRGLLNLRKFQFVHQNYDQQYEHFSKEIYEYSFAHSGRTALPLSKKPNGDIDSPTMMDLKYKPRGHDTIYRMDTDPATWGDLYFTIGEDLAGLPYKGNRKYGIPLNMSILTMPNETTPPTSTSGASYFARHAFLNSVHSPLFSISPHLNYAWKKQELVPENLTQPAIIHSVSYMFEHDINTDEFYIIPQPMYVKLFGQSATMSMYLGSNIDFESTGFNDFGQRVNYWDFSKVEGTSNSLIGDKTVVMLDFSDTNEVGQSGARVMGRMYNTVGNFHNINRFSNQTLEKVIAFCKGSLNNLSLGSRAFGAKYSGSVDPDAGGTPVLNGIRMVNSLIPGYSSFIAGQVYTNYGGTEDDQVVGIWGGKESNSSNNSPYSNSGSIQFFIGRWGFKNPPMAGHWMGEQFRP